jgi:hypothetical protein
MTGERLGNIMLDLPNLAIISFYATLMDRQCLEVELRLWTANVSRWSWRLESA